jgi:hypothetical protein
MTMTIKKTATGVCDSLARGAGPSGLGESTARPFFDEGRPACHSAGRVEPQATALGGDFTSSGGREAGPRSEAADTRIALHESCHAAAGRILGQPIGGMTCDADPASGYSGRCWGPKFESRFATGDETAPALCARISASMPQVGESRADIADIVLHVHNRVIELCAGSVGEELFLDGPAWDAVDDRKQERALAALVASSPEAIEAFINFARVEARELLRKYEHVARALAAELLIRRTLDGDQIDLCIKQAVAAKALADERERRAVWKRVEESARAFLTVRDVNAAS